jgi:SAM-dependent methyltransferase
MTQHAASVFNKFVYETVNRDAYLSGAFHLCQQSVCSLWQELCEKALAHVVSQGRESQWEVLDLGAGEGSATKYWLVLGARVTAIDISQNRLEQLVEACKDFKDRVTALEGEVVDIVRHLKSQGRHYDVVSACAFLHHLPNYLGLLEEASELARPGGQILTFEDPLWRPRLPLLCKVVSDAAYISWRLGRPDVVGGACRWLRRKMGYFSTCAADEVEYHAVRLGLDERKICALLTSKGFACNLFFYFSTPGRWQQNFGERLGVVNRFGVRAVRSSFLS